MQMAKKRIDDIVEQNEWLLEKSAYFQQHIWPIINNTLTESDMNAKIISFDLLKQFRDLTVNEYISEYHS
jgi:hypothetical protein